MSADDSRGVCTYCARVVARRLDGALRKHRDTEGEPCQGSETDPA